MVWTQFNNGCGILVKVADVKCEMSVKGYVCCVIETYVQFSNELPRPSEIPAQRYIVQGMYHAAACSVTSEHVPRLSLKINVTLHELWIVSEIKQN